MKKKRNKKKVSLDSKFKWSKIYSCSQNKAINLKLSIFQIARVYSESLRNPTGRLSNPNHFGRTRPENSDTTSKPWISPEFSKTNVVDWIDWFPFRSSCIQKFMFYSKYARSVWTKSPNKIKFSLPMQHTPTHRAIIFNCSSA